MSDEQRPPDKLEDLNREMRVPVHDRLISILEKSEEATIKFAENAIRKLINGGAAVSVLAFVGSIASKDRVPATELYAMAGPLAWFAIGVASSAVSEHFISIHYSGKQPLLNFPYFHPRLSLSDCTLLAGYFTGLRC